MEHALLSPSGASRWLTCTPSARLEEQFAETTSEAADEGTLAHSLGELLIKHKRGLVKKAEFESRLEEIESSEHYDAQMADICEEYAVFVLEQFAEAQAKTKDAMLFTEQRLDMTAYIPEGFGTGDNFIIADHLMRFIDLKYGKGLLVEAEENEQLMVYALGALKKFDKLFDITKVSMTIYQPRLDNISTWEISVKDLFAWGEKVLKPGAKTAFAGEGEFVPGDHCLFCKAKPVCKAYANQQLEIARYEFQEPILLTDEEMSDILARADRFEKWLKAVETYALDQAVNHNKNWPGFKLVIGKSNRVYLDEQLVATKLLEAGFSEEIIYKRREIQGITEMEKRIKKKVFTELLGNLVFKPQGKLALVPESHKSPAYNSLETAREEFAEED